MSASTRGVLGRAAHKIACWLSASWAEPKPAIDAAAPAVITKSMFLGSQGSAQPAVAPAGRPFLEQAAIAAAAVAAVTTPVSPAAPVEAPVSAVVPVSAVAPVDLKPASETIVEAAVETNAQAKDFRLASRLSAVSKLNAPASRASRRGQNAGPAQRAVPLVKAPEVKITKDTRLPTAFAVRARKARPSAEIIELSAAKTRMRQSSARRAA